MGESGLFGFQIHQMHSHAVGFKQPANHSPDCSLGSSVGFHRTPAQIGKDFRQRRCFLLELTLAAG